MTTPGTTEDRISTLEAQITMLEAQQSELFEQLRQARVEQWQGRIDDLEVQLHLGTLEANERLTALAEQLRNRWSSARTQMEAAPSTATEVVDTLRVGVENAYEEIRRALLESGKKVSHR